MFPHVMTLVSVYIIRGFGPVTGLCASRGMSEAAALVGIVSADPDQPPAARSTAPPSSSSRSLSCAT
jgi:hypothetical protein